MTPEKGQSQWKRPPAEVRPCGSVCKCVCKYEHTRHGEKRDGVSITWQFGLFPEVIKALKAPWVFKSQLVVEVPEEQGHEDDEEPDGSQKPQHLRRD